MAPGGRCCGNLYVVSCYLGVENGCTPDINVYPPDAIAPGKPARSLHTHLAHILDMKVSKTGVIFVPMAKESLSSVSRRTEMMLRCVTSCHRSNQA
jgi:hypothetical protein